MTLSTGTVAASVRAVAACIVAASLAACGGGDQGFSVEDRARLQSLESEIAAGIEESTSKRIAALRAAEALQPGAGACPRALPAMDDVDFDVHSILMERDQLAPGYDLRRDTRPGADNGTDRLGMIARSVGYRGQRAQILSRLHSGVERRLEAGHWESGGEADPFAFFASWRGRLDWELVIVTDAYRAPVHDGTSFIPGIVRGHAYLYDFDADSVVCTGTVDAGSSEEVGVTFDPTRDGLRQNQALIDDLHDNAFSQVLETLKVAEARGEVEAVETGAAP
ncbi:MAG: hypothetical protein AB8H86_05900 [Polyangiales bacterium]